jgi:hypothetical protein
MKIIYVSAFISQVNNRADRSLEKYMDYGKKWMSLPYPKILFMERSIISQYFPTIDTQSTKPFVFYNPYTCIVFFDPASMYFHEYADSVTDFWLYTHNTKKDTLGYMFVQCYKTEWMKMAVEMMDNQLAWAKDTFVPMHSLSTVHTDQEPRDEHYQFMWNDFGIYHMFEKHDDPETLFLKAFSTMETRNAARYRDAISNGCKFDKVYFASCWDHRSGYSHFDLYRTILWVFAGSVFAGFKTPLLKLAELMKEKCIELMTTKHHLMWEVNVWYLLYKEHPELFDFYRCNHDPSIIHYL